VRPQNQDLDVIAIYARQSDPGKKVEDGFDKTLSIATQIDDCNRLADRLGARDRHYYS
jgi:hypothetical protein